MNDLDEIRIAKQVTRVWQEIRNAYMVAWFIGWMFTCGYADQVFFEGATAIEKAMWGVLGLGFWPVILGLGVSKAIWRM